ncbi:MAG TPA: pirin family protein [Candidatus Margulisiibacteriota bacterium]|nr:pirin family protein [Candidatus Margulisiibacteriota bacterium]
MITVRKGGDRGHFDHGWLNTYHTFSFAQYYDPAQMGFGALRVINEDRVAPGRGFATHAHEDMEIITYVLEGALEHQDSMGNGSVIHPGEVQRMSAGTGVTHSEYNHSKSEPVHFLQIWILPARKGLPPSYEQQVIPSETLQGRWAVIAAPQDGIVKVHQDVGLYAAVLATGQRVMHPLRPGRRAWLQVARGEVLLNGQALQPSDGAAVTQESRLEIATPKSAEVLLFDLA